MKRVILFFLILIASVWIGIKIYEHPGYLLISYKSYAIETTFWFAVLVFLLSWLVFYFLLRLVSNLLHIPQYFREWRQRRRQKYSLKLLKQGLYQFLQGFWKPAEKQLIKNAEKKGLLSLVSYLLAAKAAHAQHADERAQQYLQTAEKKHPLRAFVIKLYEAELQLDNKDYADALTTLLPLQKVNPQHPYLLQLLAKTFLQLQEWENLKKLLPDLKKQKIFTETQLREIECKTYLKLLRHTIFSNEKALKQFWKSIPHYQKEEPEILIEYVRQLKLFNAEEDCESLLRHQLKKTWNIELFKSYVEMVAKNPAKQLEFVEYLSKAHEPDPLVSLYLGIFYLKHQLWGQAKNALEESIRAHPTAEAYLWLGYVLEKLEDIPRALLAYNKGLAFTSNKSAIAS